MKIWIAALLLGTFCVGCSKSATGPTTFIDVVQLVAGGLYTCLVNTSGAGYCFGSNLNGQIGNGDSGGNANVSNPTAVSGGITFSQIDAGVSTTCGISSGKAYCWGGASFGGYPGSASDVFNSTTPVGVQGLTSGVTKISVGASAACAVTDAGALHCWGTLSKSLGDGTTTDSAVPIQVLASGVADVSVGSNYVCFITDTQTVKCWGANDSGQLGQGTTSPSTTPVTVSGLSSISAIAAGGVGVVAHTCALTSGGAMKCWGSNSNGQIGDGTLNTALSPTDVPGLSSGVTSIATGYKHTCAVVSGAAQCWGFNDSGQLGDGTTTDQVSPTAVSDFTSQVTAIVAGGSTDYSQDQGGSHTCALLSDKTVQCWGFGGTGELGVGQEITVGGVGNGKRYYTPQAVLTP